MSADLRGSRVATLLATAGWLRVQDDVMGGIGHDLNGRVSSLDGLLQILRMDGPDKTPVGEYLQGEVTRLTEVVRVLRSLGGDLDGPAEPLMGADVAAQAAALHHRHRGLEGIRTEIIVADGLPPVRATLAVALRVLLILLSAAGRAAAASRRDGIVLSVQEEGGQVVFDVGWPGGDGAWDPSGVAVAALAETLEGAGGSVVTTPEGTARMALPAMTRAGA